MTRYLKELLLLFGIGLKPRRRLAMPGYALIAAPLAGNKNRSSHYNIFPTLLQLMGYDLAAIEPIYGKPLSQPTDDDFTFNYRFNARLGAKSAWRHIDLSTIVTPDQAPSDVTAGTP
ncbi:hypothetical protein BK658_16590 [Pseudomonas brassicacearum]|uniref:Uncharacterized protein n=1 Tax=Pseudomonas brassicacearum TaxID=930166 RepID=A0A423GPZ6_9PSED|nr:hypothetical protein BK658_16590 [Pseudomonas brassicacearum]